jgi:mannosyltransferase OCH1-like enzyme
MDVISYMWNFKPNETKMFPKDVTYNNLKYIKNFRIATPPVLEKYLVNDDFPNLVELFNKIPHWVIKADLGRLLIIYFIGGMYADVDCFINKNLNAHQEKDNVFLFVEKKCNSVNELGSRECKNPENVLRIANFSFASKTVKHPFFKEVIEECIRRLNQLFNIKNVKNISQNDILWVCGPDVITTVYHASKHKYDDIFLYDTSYLTHKCYGSWR